MGYTLSLLSSDSYYHSVFVISCLVSIMQDKEKASRELTSEILFRIKQMFLQQRDKVDSMNEQKNFGGRFNQKDKSETFYSSLSGIVEQLNKLKKKVKSADLRKERKELFEGKVAKFIEILETLGKKKIIKIQLNDYVLDLVEETQKVIKEALTNLDKFQKSGGFCCAKSYDVKPAVERSFTLVAELGYLWGSLSKLDSVAVGAVHEIYLPVEYDENNFKDIYKEIYRLWPNPVIEKVVNAPLAPLANDSHLREAHEMLFGFGRPKEVRTAFGVYKKESEKGDCNPIALNALGFLYEEGKAVPKDHQKAFEYFMKSSKMNDAEGLYKIGQYLEKGIINSKQYFSDLYGNRQAQIRGGIQYYEKAAKLGHLDAITDLGFIYEKGVLNQDKTAFYIDPHPQFALSYYLKAKKADFPRAYNNLGGLYISCSELPEDIENSNLEKGVKNLERAVQLKYPKAFINLGKCYENGVGVGQNLSKARSLYLEGAELGDVECQLQYVRSNLGTKLTDNKMMLKLIEITRQVLLVDHNNAEALYLLGIFFEKGIGMEKNRESSFYYISQSARLGHAPAITKLGDYYYSGYYTDKNIEYAEELYEQAADKLDSQALVNLGILIEKGLTGKENDPRKAQQYFEEAAKMGNPHGILIMGLENDKPDEQVVKAAQMGDLDAVKLLNRTGSMMTKQRKEKQSYKDALKKISTFYSNQTHHDSKNTNYFPSTLRSALK